MPVTDGRTLPEALAVPWFERDERRWLREQQALVAAGADFQRLPDDPPAVLRLSVTWPGLTAEPLSLTVEYPWAFPWFAPAVTAPSATWLSRHREPLTGLLCLLSDADDWDPTWTLADLLCAQLPRVLAANSSGDANGVGVLEAPVPEPVTSFMRSRWPRLLLVDGGVTFDGDVGSAQMALGTPADGEVGGRVVSVVGAGGQRLGGLGRWRLGSALVDVPWVRVATPPADVDAQAMWEHASVALGPAAPASVDAGRAELIAVVVREEVLHRVQGDTLLLLVRTRGDRRRRWTYGIVLTDPAGRDDLILRTPETAALRERSVLVCGVGAVGGSIAFELARAGLGRLDLLDQDTVTAGTVVRQLPGLDLVDLPKALAVALRVLSHNPYCDVRGHAQRLGSTHIAKRDPLGLIAQADLVVDATASMAATRFLSGHCAALSTPLIVASATSGGWGGTVARLPSAGGGCWACLELHRADRTVPWPPAKPDDRVAPIGCSESTFTGAGFDLAPVWQLAATLAADMLTGGGGEFDDVHVLAQRAVDGRRAVPSWASVPLLPHAACGQHDDRPVAVQLPLLSV